MVVVAVVVHDRIEFLGETSFFFGLPPLGPRKKVNVSKVVLDDDDGHQLFCFRAASSESTFCVCVSAPSADGDRMTN